MRLNDPLPFAALFLGLSTISGCTRESLRPLDNGSGLGGNPAYATLKARFCNSHPVISQQKVKYLFILDKSGSNQFLFNTGTSDVSETDPRGARRYGPMFQFVRNLLPDPNVITSFSLIGFNDLAFQLKDANGVLQDGFISDPTAFLDLVRPDWIGNGLPNSPSPKDGGYTNYILALSMALSVISRDAKMESGSGIIPPIKTNYQIIFVSDGAPVIVGGNGTTVTQSTSDILSSVESILALKNDPTLKAYINDIVLSTAYYYGDQAIDLAQSLLLKMANAGNGQYLQFGSGLGITYQAFAPTIQNPKPALADVFIENENAVWWDDGRLMLDSDKDGLPDEIEKLSGSDPNVFDSDGNGVSDLVEYRLKGKSCGGVKCDVATRDVYSVCDGLSPTVDAKGFRTFPDTDGDGLNDCEEFLLKSDRYNFTSNGEFIPDLISLKNGISFLTGNTNSQVDAMGEGISNYARLKQGAPTKANPRGIKFLNRESDLEPEESLDGLDCYRLTVKNIALVGPNNAIKLYLIQNSVAGENKPILKSTVGTLSGYSNTLKIEMGDFK